MIGYLQATFDAVEKQGGRITIIWMSPQRYAEFRSSVRDLPDVTSVLASFDLVTEREASFKGHDFGAFEVSGCTKTRRWAKKMTRRASRRLDKAFCSEV
jgi:hypothetical protein